MSQAFKCDICGDCVANEQNVKSQREVAKENTTVDSVPVDIGIIIKVYVSHICDACWAKVMAKVKAWINAHI